MNTDVFLRSEIRAGDIFVARTETGSEEKRQPEIRLFPLAIALQLGVKNRTQAQNIFMPANTNLLFYYTKSQLIPTEPFSVF